MLSTNKLDVRLGILGGGQLGRMLIQEALNLNLSISVLDPDKDAPCSEITKDFTVGNLNDFDTVYQFGKRMNLLTIEIENVNVDALEKLEMEGLKVYPKPAVLRMIKDKGLQKLFYQENAIPTADFYLIENKAEINAYAQHLPFMQKLRLGGYDGRGVTAIRTPDDLVNAFDAPSVLEKFINFEKEIAVIVARNASGEVALFPAVEMYFNPQVNLVEYLFTPAKISEAIAEKAAVIAKKIVEQTEFVGLLAVEFFVNKTGEVLVNEIAPRPHNSGHQSIEANITSQYEQHLRAILDLPLGSTQLTQAAVMLNLLGEPGYTGEALYEGLEACLQIEGAYIHLYGKKISKPFRKMGHVTVVNSNLDSAIQGAKEIQQTLKVKSKN